MTRTTSTHTPDAGLRESYDREATRYDERRYHSSEGRLFSDLEVGVLRSWLALADGARVLDVPAGTGRIGLALAEKGARVIGIDVSHNMLRMAAQKMGVHDSAGARLYLAQGSGSQLPFADNTFDAVTSFKFFHLIPNDRKRDFIRDMARVLKPGSRMVVEFNSPFYGGVLAALRYYLRKKHPGGMRMKCIFPDQVRWLFAGLEVTRTCGVKLPLIGALAAVVGRRRAEAFNLWFGRIPGAKYLAYAIMIEARKPLAEAR